MQPISVSYRVTIKIIAKSFNVHRFMIKALASQVLWSFHIRLFRFFFKYYTDITHGCMILSRLLQTSNIYAWTLWKFLFYRHDFDKYKLNRKNSGTDKTIDFMSTLFWKQPVVSVYMQACRSYNLVTIRRVAWSVFNFDIYCKLTLHGLPGF